MDRSEALAIIAETIAAVTECREKITEETHISEVVNVGQEAILVYSALIDKGVLRSDKSRSRSISVTPEYTVGNLLDDFGFGAEVSV